MRIEPTEEKEWWQARSFGSKKIYRETIRTSGGRCIQGSSGKHDYFVYVEENPRTGFVKHKLYCVNELLGKEKERWVKSFLRFFKEDSDNKLSKEIRSRGKRNEF